MVKKAPKRVQEFVLQKYSAPHYEQTDLGLVYILVYYCSKCYNSKLDCMLSGQLAKNVVCTYVLSSYEDLISTISGCGGRMARVGKIKPNNANKANLKTCCL